MEFRKTMVCIILSLCVLFVLGTLMRRHYTHFEKSIDEKYFDGTALAGKKLSGQDKLALAMLIKYLDSFSPENVFTWSSFHPALERYDFHAADQYLMMFSVLQPVVFGQALVDDRNTPDWVFESENGRPIGREALLQRMKDHIITVTGHFKGLVAGWDGVAMALDATGQLRPTRWLKIAGEDYIQKAFEAARQADAGAQLYYCDYALENPQKRQGLIRLLQNLKANGVQVDGVTMVGHYGLKDPKAVDIEACITDLYRSGFKVKITDFDIEMRSAPGDQDGWAQARGSLIRRFLNVSTDALPADSVHILMRKRYAELFKLFRTHRDKISDITFAGVSVSAPLLDRWLAENPFLDPALYDPAAPSDAKVKSKRRLALESVK